MTTPNEQPEESLPKSNELPQPDEITLLRHDIAVHEHQDDVRKNMLLLVTELLQRAQDHDASKMESPEREVYAASFPKLAKTEYGSPEYEELLQEVKVAIDSHYSKNRHHPEFFQHEEVWKPVLEYEGLYLVSSLGRVKNEKGQVLKGPRTPKGYIRIQLTKQGESKNFLVHRLVAAAFVDIVPGKPFVNHKNGNKLDNRFSNLEWVTASENQLHAYNMGLKKPKVKYVVKCIEFDIVTEGCLKMEQALRSRGHEKANAASIWACINDEEGKLTHLDLHFEGTLIEELGDISFVGSMDLVDLFEMISDWVSATKRNKNGNIFNSIQLNSSRFGIDDLLSRILRNTVERYF